MAVLISCNEVRQRFEVVLNREFFFYWLNEEFNVAVRQKDEEVVLHVDNAGDIMWVIMRNTALLLYS